MIMRMDAGSIPIGYLVFRSEGEKTSIGAMGDLAQNIIRPLVQKNVPGTVAISFGPAEEQIASRPFIVRAGYFKDVDAIIYLHIRDSLATGYGVQNYAAISSIFTFHGKTAHGAVNLAGDAVHRCRVDTELALAHQDLARQFQQDAFEARDGHVSDKLRAGAARTLVGAESDWKRGNRAESVT